MPAERVKNLVKERLHKFGLKMEDIVAATTDGASVIRSFARMWTEFLFTPFLLASN